MLSRSLSSRDINGDKEDKNERFNIKVKQKGIKKLPNLRSRQQHRKRESQNPSMQRDNRIARTR